MQDNTELPQDAPLNFQVQVELGKQPGKFSGPVRWRLASSCRIGKGSIQDGRRGKKKAKHQEPHFHSSSTAAH